MYFLLYQYLHRLFYFLRGFRNIKPFKIATPTIAMGNELDRLVGTIVDPGEKKVRTSSG